MLFFSAIKFFGNRIAPIFTKITLKDRHLAQNGTLFKTFLYLLIY